MSIELYGLWSSLFFQGVGGEYPVSSTSASEAANEQISSQLERNPSMLPGLVVLRTMPLTGAVRAFHNFITATPFFLIVVLPVVSTMTFILVSLVCSLGFFRLPYCYLNCWRYNHFRTVCIRKMSVLLFVLFVLLALCSSKKSKNWESMNCLGKAKSSTFHILFSTF